MDTISPPAEPDAPLKFWFNTNKALIQVSGPGTNDVIYRSVLADDLSCGLVDAGNTCLSLHDVSRYWLENFLKGWSEYGA